MFARVLMAAALIVLISAPAMANPKTTQQCYSTSTNAKPNAMRAIKTTPENAFLALRSALGIMSPVTLASHITRLNHGSASR